LLQPNKGFASNHSSHSGQLESFTIVNGETCTRNDGALFISFEAVQGLNMDQTYPSKPDSFVNNDWLENITGNPEPSSNSCLINPGPSGSHEELLQDLLDQLNEADSTSKPSSVDTSSVSELHPARRRRRGI
jgi:hypothetical protein